MSHSYILCLSEWDYNMGFPHDRIKPSRAHSESQEAREIPLHPPHFSKLKVFKLESL